MTRIISTLLLITSLAAAQSVDTYARVLSIHLRQLLTAPPTGNETPSQLLAADIVRIAPSTAKPSRATVARFATELFAALANTAPSQANTDQLGSGIVTALYSPGSNAPAFQQQLISMGVVPAAAESIAKGLSDIGAEVRSHSVAQR